MPTGSRRRTRTNGAATCLEWLQCSSWSYPNSVYAAEVAKLRMAPRSYGPDYVSSTPRACFWCNGGGSLLQQEQCRHDPGHHHDRRHRHPEFQSFLDNCPCPHAIAVDQEGD